MPTEQETARYNVYRLILTLAGLVPRGFADWLVTYHRMKRKRERKLRFGDER